MVMGAENEKASWTGSCRSAKPKPVGAGLLANAVCQATSMLAVPPSSRASPLPQGVGMCG
ncbi:hypothetical protein C0J56_12200 [Pseudomonas fluorescens]|nr:hypothetical protein C0J56_12200 [Pseudomonas fluorescens]